MLLSYGDHATRNRKDHDPDQLSWRTPWGSLRQTFWQVRDELPIPEEVLPPLEVQRPSGLFMNCSDESVRTKTFLGRSSRNRGPKAGSWVARYRKHSDQSTGRKGFVQGAQRPQQQTALVSMLEFLRTKSCCSMQSLKFLLKILIFFCSPLKKKKIKPRASCPAGRYSYY